MMKQASFLSLISFLFSFLIFPPKINAQIVKGVDYSNRSDVYRTFDMAGEDVFGQRFYSENFTYVDPETGTKVNALTTSRHNNSKMYQTHPQWTPDGKYVVITSDRTSTREDRDRQAYAISMENFEIVQITTGDGSSNLHLGWHKNRAYHFRDNQLIELNLEKLLEDSEQSVVGSPENYEHVIAIVPDSIRPSGLGLDAEENRAFFSSGLDENLSALYSVDFSSGETKKILEVPFRIGHLQSNPFVTGEVMYCWETGGDSPQRMWYMSVDKNGKVENRPIYEETDYDWVTHEVFMGPDHILFNLMGHLDRLRTNQTGVISLNIRSDEKTFHGQVGMGGYWHCNATPDGKWIVADTFDGELYRINAEDNEDKVLLTQGHRHPSISPFTSEAHLHPSVSPDGRWVLINSSLFTESDVLIFPLFPSK